MKKLSMMLGMGLVLAAVGFDSPVARAQQDGDAEVAISREISLDLGNNVSLKLVKIKTGTFLMGSPADEKDRQDEDGLAPEKRVNDSAQMEVTISKPFYIGVYEVTVDQYAEFMKETGTEHPDPGFKQTGDHPAAGVSWNNAQLFCEWLSKKSGMKVGLPTEAQWEYACRAGTKTRFNFGDDDADFGDYAWYDGNSGQMTHPVGEKKPNAWGLYDMHGNVWEWCADFYGAYEVAGADPTGPKDGERHVVRGGSWGRTPAFCRTTCRRKQVPQAQCTVGGFRVAVADTETAPPLEEFELEGLSPHEAVER